MKLGWLFFVAVGTACTSASAILDDHDVSPGESVRDGGLDAAQEMKGGPCSDCEYFPETCSPSTFCPNGPFAPDTLGGSIDGRTAIISIRGRSVDDVWAVGALGAIAHFDGTSWTRSDSGSQETIRALWLRDSTEIALSTRLGQIFTRGAAIQDGGAEPSDGGWSSYALPVVRPTWPNTRLLTAAWGAPGGEELWCAATNNAILRLRQLPSMEFELQSVIPERRCRSTNSGARCGAYSMHGASANELWVVGALGEAVRIADADSATPSVKAFNSLTWNTLKGVWAASASDVWAVGATGTIRRYSGDPMFWDIISDVPTSVDLNAVWGFSSTDVWAVGDAGVVLHYDGTSWSRVKMAGLGIDRPNLFTVWGAEPGHVWIGGHGVILSLGGKP